MGQLGTVARPPSSALAIDCAAAASMSCFRLVMAAEMILERRLIMRWFCDERSGNAPRCDLRGRCSRVISLTSALQLVRSSRCLAKRSTKDSDRESATVRSGRRRRRVNNSNANQEKLGKCNESGDVIYLARFKAMAGKWVGNRKTARGGEAPQAGGADAIFSADSEVHLRQAVASRSRQPGWTRCSI